MRLSYNLFYEKFKRKLFDDYPSTIVLEKDLDLTHMVSPFILQIDKATLDHCRDFIRSLYFLSRTSAYQKKIHNKNEAAAFLHERPLPVHQSVLMGYDFHTPPGRQALIEVNTNAAMFLISELLHQIQEVNVLSASHISALESLKESFLQEMRSFYAQEDFVPKKVAIVDENILEQKRYVEFLMFKDLFNGWGWNAEIIEFQDLRADKNSRSLLTPTGEKIDLIYNRFCDFYFSRPESSHLREAFIDRWCCITPQPYEYFLLADKERMAEWSSKNFQEELKDCLSISQWQIINQTVLMTQPTNSFTDIQSLWEKRNQLIFKPQNQYGGKSVYRGKGLTHAVFARSLEQNFLVQEYFPAPEPIFSDPHVSSSGWKYDLRFYVYGDQIQNVVARLYKGQVTNFTQEYGGFASVIFQ